LDVREDFQCRASPLPHHQKDRCEQISRINLSLLGTNLTFSHSLKTAILAQLLRTPMELHRAKLLLVSTADFAGSIAL
jgi:hypothetical protein